MKRLIPILLIAAAGLGGCASREGRIQSALVEAGVPGGLAKCMAPGLADNLTNNQLRSLGELGKVRAGREDVPLQDIVRDAGRSLDPQVVTILLRTSLGCMVRG